MTITKEQFKTYVEIQRSGVTNMFDVKVVIDYSEGVLDKEMILEIMTNYSNLKEKFRQK